MYKKSKEIDYNQRSMPPSLILDILKKHPENISVFCSDKVLMESYVDIKMLSDICYDNKEVVPYLEDLLYSLTIKEILKIVKSNKEDNLLKELKIKDNCDSYTKKTNI